MEAAAAALLGAVIGGFLTLAATLFVELRRDRRRQIGAARLVVAEIGRNKIEIGRLTYVDQEKAVDNWIKGPFPAISSDTWRMEAVYFVGALSADEFQLVDSFARETHAIGQVGFMPGSGDQLLDFLETARRIVEPLTVVRWVDRHVWRL